MLQTKPAIRMWLGFLLLLAATCAHADPPRLELSVNLDPASRELSAVATLTNLTANNTVSLSAFFQPTRLELDGRTQPLPKAPGAGLAWLLKPGGKEAKQLTIAYHGRLASLAELDHRQVLQALPPMAGAEGSFLPGGSGWHPHPGVPFSYRITLRLPQGQKGLVPGALVRESLAKDYEAEFDFPHPADGIDLMAGPYAVNERTIKLDSGKTVRLRTWFHSELTELAGAYLTDSATYIQRYSRLIGDYPYTDFSIVSSPLPTGFGMPSLTYLGRDVLRLPFIRATSLGHEVLHNWWGNGVAPEWTKGNWSEGLTTFLADYAYKEDQSAEAARDMRLGWLRDLAAVPPEEDTPLKDFTSRRHGISSIVGYNKAAMVFLMLRDQIGEAAFNRGLRLVWQRHRHGSADWEDLQRAFSTAAERDLSTFFAQWVERAGAPKLQLVSAKPNDDHLRVTLAQSNPVYVLQVPLRLSYAQQADDRVVTLNTAREEFKLRADEVGAVELDPDYRLWRRLDPDRLPPILREVFIAPRPALIMAGSDTAIRTAAEDLATRVLDAPPAIRPHDGTGLPGEDPVLLIGLHDDIDALLQRLGLPPRPASLAAQGTAQVWAARDTNGRPYAVVSAQDANALTALQRPLPHYGRQSWLSFAAAKVMDKGVWPARAERVPVQAAAEP